MSAYLAVLQREDPAISEILRESAHVALYRFDQGVNRWDRMQVEGPSYIVKAVAVPILRLIVLNKLDKENFTLDLTSVHKVKLQDPYIMMKTNVSELHILYI